MAGEAEVDGTILCIIAAPPVPKDESAAGCFDLVVVGGEVEAMRLAVLMEDKNLN